MLHDDGVQLAALLALPLVAFACLCALANLFVWPRGRAAPLRQRVSVLFPARNEAPRIEAAVRAAASSAHEVIVVDDGSTDDTPAILARLGAELQNLRVVAGAPLPSGWIGKVHACAQAAAHATGDLLVFVDCDTVLAPEGLGRLASIVDDYDADVVTAAPRQVTGSLPEHLVVPLLQLTWLAWLPLPLVWRSRDPRFLVAVGQVLAFRRAAYARIGGHAAVRGELVEDMAICRRAKEQALRVVFADGHHIATCRMYGSARELWQGFSKNLYEGLGNKPSALVVVVALYLLAFVVPYAALPARAAVVGVALNVVLRVGLALRLRTRLATQLFSAVLHPLGVLVVVAIALNSALWTWRGALSWSGRVYAPRERRS